ncbi:right-handed parallel beta-helix repeat-containing protein [Draconibacterium halophilum]|uniref:Right-handed parallel beta-helix repeat-containing protein n=1 Tax=Draconibacterium halophilum TaxID=2706887 RepID=A0A6C0RFN8_9BACT|nr:right-handed parallel beta-helix repeat-containing protein [Draconibacterium halophilum]QIA08887.1 right-handed parallel beta-helix repeat-containing protein [Draconibacterium halophilum]
MKTGLFLLLVSSLLTFALQVSGSSTPSDTTYIFLKDYGLNKTRKKNAIKHFYKALDDLKTDQPKVLVFSTGTYHFYPDGCKTKVYYEANTANENPKTCAFHFENIKNLVIDGRGSHLIFHQEMQPFTFDNCQNITLKNVTIDWEQPFIAQAEVLRVTDHYMDIGLDPKETPYRLIEGKIFFDVGNSQSNEWTKTLEFDRKGRYIVTQTGDSPCLGENWNAYHGEPTMPGIVRLHFSFKRKPQIGNYLVMQHAEPTHAGVFILESENVTVQNTRLFHAAGSGILAQYSKDLTFDRYQAIPNRAKNRYFGGGNDGLQIVNCQGNILVNNSTFHGLVNEPVNVHGISIQVKEVISDNQLECSFLNNTSKVQNWGHPGDQLSFINGEQDSPNEQNTIKTVTPAGEEHFILLFEKSVSNAISVGDVIENLSWTPNLTVKNSHFKSSRASGLLIATSGKVVIENNTFESSGSGILITGNTDNLYKSGAATDVIITENIFTSKCITSSYQYNEAIISIFPVIRAITEDMPAYHRNIRIEQNQFYPFDYPLVYALSVDGLSFNDNTVTRSYDFTPLHDRLYTFSFEYCKRLNIMNNNISEDVLGKNIYLKKTTNDQLKTDMESIFTIEKF